MRPRRTLAILLFLFAGISGWPQTTAAVQSGQMMTFRELLTMRNIKLTEPSLVDDLQNPDSQVRAWSALVLAEDKATDAVPAISKALQSENVPEAKAGIALALGQLGDPQGIGTLKGMCSDSAIPPYLRVYATMYLLALNDGGCLNTIFDVLQSNADSGARVLAFSQLSRFHEVSQTDSQRIVTATLKALADDAPAMRIAAARALSGFSPAIALPALQNAITAEQVEAVKIQMQSSLQHLREQEAH